MKRWDKSKYTYSQKFRNVDHINTLYKSLSLHNHKDGTKLGTIMKLEVSSINVPVERKPGNF